MEVIAIFLLVVILILVISLLVTKGKAKQQLFKAEDAKRTAEAVAEQMRPLEKYKVIDDAQMEAERIRRESVEEADRVRKACDSAKAKASQDADEIVQKANAEARKIAGEALAVRDHVDDLRKEEKAILNRINGYGDEYIIPTTSLLDELAEEMAFTEPGEKLKAIRVQVRNMTKNRQAATCDYVEASRAMTAAMFVTDAFNGKVDSTLSKVRNDNYGKLKQEIEDAFALVNKNGKAFRNAVITPEYLALRIDELKWACTVQELKRQQQEEQREIREKMREDEKVRREAEKAAKDSAREKALIDKAKEKARAEMEAAHASQDAAKSAEWEKKFQELEQRAKEAEEKNQRAISLAQQTKHGNVYIISNVGAFGENVYKIGMTRRLDPEDRIRELGDASVPFPFDIHAFIESDDAPSLETELHKAFMIGQMNKVNPRKEFFRVNISEIRNYVEQKGFHVVWTMDAKAAEYRETLHINDEIKRDPSIRVKWERQMEREESEEEQDAEEKAI